MELLSSYQAWFLFMLAALIVGFSKTSTGGIGILAVVFMALAIPGKASPGVLLPLLVFSDIVAVIYYRQHTDWPILRRILPTTFAGVVAGYFLVKMIPAIYFNKVIGTLILFMVVLGYFFERHKASFQKATSLTLVIGFFAGAASMISNAAGPIFGIYLLLLGLNKDAFVGTRAWFFFLMNAVKLPFSAGLGLMNLSTLTLDVMAIPLVLVGAYLGKVFLHWINVRVFNAIVRATALISGVSMLFD